MDKDDVILSHPFITNTQLYYNLTWVVSKGLERRECCSEHSSLGITHILQHLRLKQQKQEHMGCFGTYKHSCMFMYISSELQEFSLYKYNIPQWYLARAYNTKKPISLSREYSKKYS